MRKISVCFIFAVVALGVGTHVSVAEQTPSQPLTPSVTAGVMSDGGEGAPYTLPGALQYDITSQINGRAYRIFVSTPYNYQPTLAYPVLYVLDGNWIFPSANRFMRWSETRDPGIVVGIGYPTDDDYGEISQARLFDLTPSPVWRTYTGGGGLDAFLRVIEEEVKPFVMTRYRVDSAKQSLYGHSLGGLAVLRCLFLNPESFSTYIAGSPAICWNNREVLADEAAFSTRARAGELRLKLLITSAEDEQYHGNDPQSLAADAKVGEFRLVDNASELAARLAELNPEQITVVRTIFDGESHHSSQAANISRAVRFAFSPTMMRLAPEVLARYVGIYQVSPTISITIRQTSDGLTGYMKGIG
ncbi:alpha/beta hydrolase, partial [Candidatus Latescibacterota bacterium]